jgi:hypothetical protein
MRFFEFTGTDDTIDRYVIVLKNLIGRYASKKENAKLNWPALNKLVGTAGIEMTADYETFKAMYDSNPALQGLVKNFNADGIELNVPGAPEEPAEQEPTQGSDTTDSQAAVDKIAASAAPANLG